MADKTLVEFVKESLQQGQSREAIHGALAQAGWKSGEVDAALAVYSDVAFPVAVPRPQPYLSARQAFLYLLFFILLGIVAFSLGSLLFALIDYGFPDKAEAGGYTIRYRDAQVRSGISGVLVGTPIFLWLGYILRGARERSPELQRSRIRKWLTYLSLVIAGCTLVGDATSLVYNFLGGDLTTRFVLKSLVVGVIAGAIFTYFISDAEKGDRADVDTK
ncbi:MAG: hypothetical protein KJ871_15180 [Alphaproteobacteria bacterium]|nr:hypothetical protein [Alphaproteobacteria bacterium]MBU2084812.1 hypothetical protein [Alphaproteobacteria bacterium]MBU2144110.1 hypothetical protein [Alphaproteobacteria bacterium]MBU2198225.1 hypothetical protein [Alphaproteobacteria bacterium]